MEKPIFWYQGLFLQPQHLQLNDKYNHELLSPYYKYLNPYLYGVEDLSFLKNDLANNVIRIEQGNLWFQDKTYVEINKNAIIEPRVFDESNLEDGKPMTVYIGLKKFSDQGKNVSVHSSKENFDGFGNINSRFVTSVESDNINDLYDEGSPAQVKNMSFFLRIFFEYELEYLGNFNLIPVMTIEKSGESIVATDSYIPPALTINSSQKLKEYVNETYNQLIARSYELESYKTERGINQAEFGSRDMVFLLSLRSINRYIPMLDHLIKSNVHPWEIYGVFRQLAGELSTFSENISVLGIDENDQNLMPVYNHLSLGECFMKSFQLVALLLDEITAGPKYIVPLKLEGDYFTANLEKEYFPGKNRFYIAIKSLTEPGELIENIDISLKAGSDKILSVIIQKSLPGIEITHMKNPPQELPRRAYTTYYQLNSSSEMWDKVKQHNNLSIYWKTAPQDVKLELMVIG
ncbi:MAG: type VI secretion system baseplate subunit TssK [Desulfobacteraceae bacterium]|nr:type VI secretion system baseplate subunit TssK [Desulfobacteraceae bacterium]